MTTLRSQLIVRKNYLPKRNGLKRNLGNIGEKAIRLDSSANSVFQMGRFRMITNQKQLTVQFI